MQKKSQFYVEISLYLHILFLVYINKKTMTKNIKIIYLIFSIQILGWGIINQNFNIAVFGIVNLILLGVWLFMDNDFENINLYFQRKFQKITPENIDEEENTSYKILVNMIFYFTKHYLFILSFFILFIWFLNNYFFDISRIDLWWAGFRFILFSIINIKNIYKWEIYFAYKKLYPKHIYLLLSFVVIARTFSYLKDLDILSKTSIAFVLWSIFYFMIIKFSWLDKVKKFFSMNSVRVYLIFDILFIWFLVTHSLPQFKQYLSQEKVIYKDKIVEKSVEKIVYVYTGGKQLSWWNLTGKNLTWNSLTWNLVFTWETLLSWFEYLKEKKNLTYYDVIPYLVAKYELNSNGLPNIVFDNLSIKDPQYNAFKIAYSKKIFGKNSDPKTVLKCQNLIVVIWLLEWWKVDYNKDTVFDEFWKRSQRNWTSKKVWCNKQTDLITYKNLIF